MKIMEHFFGNELEYLLSKYNAEIRKKTNNEITVEFKNGNWFNVRYYERPAYFEMEPEILLSSNISFFGYPAFKGHWGIDGNISHFIKEQVFPTLNYLQGPFALSMEEICNCLDQLLVTNKIEYSKEKRSFSFEYWNNEYGKKDLLEYDGLVYNFGLNNKKINLYIQNCKFIYIEIEKSNGEKNSFPWFYFVNPHTIGKKSVESLFRNLNDFLLED